MNINQYIISQLARKISKKEKLSLECLSRLKRMASKKYNLPCPTNINLLESYRQMTRNKEIKPDKNIENLLVTKDIRTSSGVAIVAVLTKPYPCPGACVYCPSEKGMPKSYLSNEPAVMRAILTDFHPYKQVQGRIRALEKAGHKTDKIELIIMGGTFSYLKRQYQTWFVKECFRACNDEEAENQSRRSKTSSLKEVQKTNEKSAHRIVGLTLETRPDYIDEKEIMRMRKLGATRVELGVQSIYDDVLRINKRGHSRDEIIKATRLLKEAGFKVGYHMMPNLPGSTYKRDLEMFKELFSNPDFQPDMLKIYPCVVVKNAPLYKWLKQGKYKPYSCQKLVRLLAEVKKLVPYYVRITRVVRDIPATSIIAGNKISNLRQVLREKSERENWSCKCIRCREVRNRYQLSSPELLHLTSPAKKTGFSKQERVQTHFLEDERRKIVLFRQDYNASEGREIFLSFEDPERKNLYSLLRLRINSHDCSFAASLKNLSPACENGLARQSQNPAMLSSRKKTFSSSLKKKRDAALPIVPALQNAAIIREVHTFGKLVSIDSKSKESPQHTGLGKKLISEAEKIVRNEFNLKKIAVISGVGVRDYYRKLGYRLKDGYMVKTLL